MEGKISKTFGMFKAIVVGCIIGTFATVVVAKTTGWLYGHGLIIESIPGTTLAKIDAAGGVFPRAYTKAELLLVSPSTKGGLYYCSDCTVSPIVQSTGTALHAFSIITDSDTYPS